MQEDFLHYIWKFKKFDFANATTVDGSPVVISNTGVHNTNSGPDFFNSRLKIGDQSWAGNVEIHIRSSDWYAHKHEEDPNYDNVIYGEAMAAYDTVFYPGHCTGAEQYEVLKTILGDRLHAISTGSVIEL